MFNPLMRNSNHPLCSICKDKRQASIKDDDAKRIYNNIERLKRYIKDKGYDLDNCYKNRLSLKTKGYNNITLQSAKSLCYVHQHCMCGSCTKIKNHIDNANRINCKISEDIIKIYYLLIQLKEEDNQEYYRYIKSTLQGLFNPSYYKAGHLISMV